MPSNIGYAAAMNAGAARFVDRYDYLLFMTHEVVLKSDCVAQLVSACRTDRDLGMVGPALRIHASDTAWSFGGWFTSLGDVRHNLDESRADEAEWLDGACLLIRSAAFTKADRGQQSWWQRAFARILQVQPSDRAIAVAPGDRAAGYAALQLELALARAASERRDAAAWRAALLRADGWLLRLWPDSPELRRQRAQLRALQAQPHIGWLRRARRR